MNNSSADYILMNFTYRMDPLNVPFSMKVTYSSLISFLLIVGIPGNVLVVYVVGRYSAMQTTTNLYLMSLSIADLLHLAQIVFVVNVILTEKFIFGKWLCKLHLTLEATNSLAVTFILTATSVDRYLAVCHPLKSQTFRSPKVARTIIVLIWLICLFMLCPLFIYANITMNTKNNETTPQCMIDLGEKKLTFVQYTFILGFALPVCSISVFYLLVISKLRNIHRANISRSKDRRDSVQRIIKMILALILIYIVLWFPYWIHQWIIQFNDVDPILSFYVGLFTQFLGYLNSSINPILYAFLSQNFRVMFVQILNCQGNRFLKEVFPESSVIKRGRSLTSQIKTKQSSINNKTANSNFNHQAKCDDQEKNDIKNSVEFLETHFE
uniref:GCR320 n=1 Tax=Schmidtea mediterranea TaxID=79327 RepID=A0A193KUQ1_SCHMD|nr:GCR320 [Schmidtea mediterranea]